MRLVGAILVALLPCACGWSVLGHAPASLSLRTASTSRPALALNARPRSIAPISTLRASQSDDDQVAVADQPQKPKVSKLKLMSASSTNPRLGDAITEAVREAYQQLPEGVTPSFMQVLLSSSYCSGDEASQVEDVPEIRLDDIGQVVTPMGLTNVIDVIARLFAKRGWAEVPVIGSTVKGFMTESGDAEESQGLTLVLGYLPGVKVHPFKVPKDVSENWRPKDWSTNAGFGDFMQGPPRSGNDKAKASAIVIMTHPDSAEKTKTILSGLSFAYPGAKVIGGAAGKASPDHGAGVFMFSSIKATEDKQACMGSTAVGLALEGDMAIDAVVAQGSRPIGPSFEVVEVADDGLTIKRLRDTVTGTDMEGPPMTLFDMAGFMGLIDMSDVQAALSFVALGVSLNPLIEDMDEQEYIVRPISDLEKDGPVMLTEPVRVGQIVRFHVRDAENAKAELDSLMMRWKLEKGQKGLDGMFPAGALLFTDESRGRRLYSEDGVEVSKFRETFPGVSMGGGYFTGAIGELPNFSSASKAQKKAPVAPAEGGMTLPGISMDSFENHVDVHSVAAAFCVIYGPAEEEA